MAHILLLTPQLPYPPQQGTSLRNFHLLRALAHRHTVTLLSFAESDRAADTARLAELARVLPPVRRARPHDGAAVARLADVAHAGYGPTTAQRGV